MKNNFFDIEKCLDSLKQKRTIFHSEADFQFSFAWEIQSHYPNANIRLEYCPANAPTTHIDIMVFYLNMAFPIELKYKTAELTFDMGAETFNLKKHSAQDLGKYDFLKDIQRLEAMSMMLPNYSCGYTVWLTNEHSYWNPPSRPHTIYEEFSVHQAAQKHGCMGWLSHASAGTIKGREVPITLNGTYDITWQPYSDIDIKNGVFKYAVLPVTLMT